MTHHPPSLDTKRIEVRSPGAADVLRLVSAKLLQPGSNDVVVRHLAIGVNFHDIYVRSGAYRTMPYPGVPGIEAVGVVEWAGPNVESVREGDVVAYIDPTYGAYATRRIVEADRLVVVPPGLDSAKVAASFLKGVTADMLLSRVAPMAAGSTIVVHGAAGGVGQILVQLAKSRQIRVIGVVGSDAKSQFARQLGCIEVAVRGATDLARLVRDVTDGSGADVVFDGVGAATFQASQDSLRPFGHLCVFGQASGPIPPVDLSALAVRSLAISRPVVFHHVADRRTLQKSADLLFSAIGAQSIEISSPTRFSLNNSAEAHRYLEGGESAGSIILTTNE